MLRLLGVHILMLQHFFIYAIEYRCIFRYILTLILTVMSHKARISLPLKPHLCTTSHSHSTIKKQNTSNKQIAYE